MRLTFPFLLILLCVLVVYSRYLLVEVDNDDADLQETGRSICD